jgi:hypothetical protein
MAAGDTQTFNNMVSALPMNIVIGQPFMEMVKVSAASAAAYIQWFREACLDKDGKSKMVEFDVETPRLDANGNVLDADGKLASTTGKAAAVDRVRIVQPLAAIVSHPNFMPDTLSISFEMEVTTAEAVETQNAAEIGIEAGGSYGVVTASMSAKASHSEKSTRSTDTTSRLSIQATGSNHGIPEGMAKTLDLLRELCSKPVPAASGSKPNTASAAK